MERNGTKRAIPDIFEETERNEFIKCNGTERNGTTDIWQERNRTNSNNGMERDEMNYMI